MIVEDNEDNLFTLRQMLAPLSLEIVAASNGRQAIDYCRRGMPDLVIMDMQMPGMSGLQATGAIRAMPGGANVPILALTAQAMSGIASASWARAARVPVETGRATELRAVVDALAGVATAGGRRRRSAARRREGRMARILLVDNEAGDRPAAARALGVREQELEQVESIAAALVRAAEAGHPFVLVVAREPRSVAGLAPVLERRRAARDVRRVRGRRLPAGAGRIAQGRQRDRRALFRSVLRSELQSVAGEAARRGAIADRCLSLDGRAFSVRAYPLSERGVVLYIRDATDEREREIGRLQSEKLASIGMLAAGVAHEIDNPAAFVLANIEALTGHMRLIEDKLRELPGADAARASLSNVLFEASAILQESKEGMARIQRIVRDLGSFSHADEDVSVPISVNAAVESALTMLRNELKYRARVEQDLRATRLVLASAPRLGQVFLNPISNAVQALEEADVKRNLVRVRSYDEGDHVVVEVSDNGPGIAARRGSRGSSSRSSRPSRAAWGPGWACRSRSASCAAWAARSSSTAGRGRARLPGANSGHAAAPAARPSSVPETTPSRIFSRRRILAVDDEALLLKAYRRMLTDAHELVTALGGPRGAGRAGEGRALRRRAVRPADAGDVRHGAARGGAGALSRARRRFVFVTGGAFSGDARRFLEESVPAVIQKPFNVDDLLRLVDTIASGKGKRVHRQPRRGRRRSRAR